MLVSAEEAKEYIEEHGPLVKGQISWTATQGLDGGPNWVSCGDQNPDELGLDHKYLHSNYNLYWSENLDYEDKENGKCDWAGHVVIYKPIPPALMKYKEYEQKPTVKLTLKSHGG